MSSRGGDKGHFVDVRNGTTKRKSKEGLNMEPLKKSRGGRPSRQDKRRHRPDNTEAVLKRIERTGFGEFLFFDWRYNEDGTLNPEFEFNKEHLKGANILLAGQNFGSGSSREHAPWALRNTGSRLS
jgi:hypothetical protein